MFDFKQEINKYHPLPEPEEAKEIVDNNDVEDIMDILRQIYARSNKG